MMGLQGHVPPREGGGLTVGGVLTSGCLLLPGDELVFNEFYTVIGDAIYIYC